MAHFLAIGRRLLHRNSETVQGDGRFLGSDGLVLHLFGGTARHHLQAARIFRDDLGNGHHFGDDDTQLLQRHIDGAADLLVDAGQRCVDHFGEIEFGEVEQHLAEAVGCHHAFGAVGCNLDDGADLAVPVLDRRVGGLDPDRGLVFSEAQEVPRE